MRKSFFESREKTTRRLSKGLLFVLVIVLSGINPRQVRADLILEPENQFYQIIRRVKSIPGLRQMEEKAAVFRETPGCRYHISIQIVRV